MQQILFRMAPEKGSNPGNIGQDCKYWPGCHLRRVKMLQILVWMHLRRIQMLQILVWMASKKGSNAANIGQDGI